MPRALTAGMQAAVAAQTGVLVYFIELESSGGTVRITTAPFDVSWDSQTWEAVGGALAFGGVSETADPSGQGVDLTLSGVDQTIISLILNNSFRGRAVVIYMAHVASDGTIVTDPIELFRGLQLADYEVRETISDEGPNTCEVSTTVQSTLAALRGPLPIHTNVHSHNDMLKRAGVATGDTFFQNVPDIAGRNILWGVPGYTRGDRPSRGTAKRRRS